MRQHPRSRIHSARARSRTASASPAWLAASRNWSRWPTPSSRRQKSALHHRTFPSPSSLDLRPSHSLAEDTKVEGLRIKVYQDSGIRTRHTSVLRFSDDLLEEEGAV